MAAITFLAGAGVSVVLFLLTERWETNRIRQDFLRHADNRVAALQLTLRERLGDAEVLGSVLSASEHVDARMFQQLAKEFIERNSSVESVQWVPLVHASKREAFERSIHEVEAGSDSVAVFGISDLNAEGAFVQAPGRHDYFPVMYHEPSGRERWIGLDLGTDPVFRRAAAGSLAKRAPAATPRLTSSGHSEADGFAFRILVPVYQQEVHEGNITAEPEPEFRGFASIVLRINELVDFSWSHLRPVGLDKLIFDASAPESDAHLYTQWSRLREVRPETIPLSRWRTGLYKEARLPVADRQWSAIIRAAPAFLQSQRTHAPEGVLTGGLLLTISLTGYLALISRRTFQLGQLNEKLIAEVFERKRAEEDLRSSRDDLSAILNSVDVAILIQSPEGGILAVNDKMLELYRVSRDDAVRGSLRDDFSDPKNPLGNLSEVWGRVLEGGSFSMEWTARRPSDGSTFPVELFLRKVTWNGRAAIMTVVHDLTEKKTLEKRFLRSQRLESIGTLASGIAHDLNNILTPVIMAARYLELKRPGSEDSEVLSTIQASAQRGADIVKQVLTFARGIEGQHIPIQVGHLIKDMQKIVRETFPKNIGLQSSIPKDLWTVNADVTQLHQVLMNLCVNARDAMPDGGSLFISAENVEVPAGRVGLFADGKPGPHVLIRVADNGQGIPPAILEKVFDPFFTTKPVGEGTGLGLSTVLGIVRSHGGFLDVQTEVGRGTSFLIYMPAQIRRLTGRADGARPAIPQGNGECVLVVDDEANIRGVTGHTLTQHGYVALLASNGKEALETISTRGRTPSAVITDVMMPVMDGVSLIQELRKTNPELPVIACTGWSQEGVRDKLNALGVNCVLQKPYTSEMLLTTLHKSLHPQFSKS